MSDYITLEALKGMTNNELYRRWLRGHFPFDLAECGDCVTVHGLYLGREYECSHHEFSKMASPVKNVAHNLNPHLEEIYALRLYFRDLYPSNPPELDAIPKEAICDLVKR